MPLPVQNPSYDAILQQIIVAFGDSLTDSIALAKRDDELWLPVLCTILNNAGALTIDQNQGHDGGNSNSVIPGMLSRMFEAWMNGLPRLGIIFIGTNDLTGHADSDQTISALTSSGTTATATITSNTGLWVGAWVTVSGANQANYNGTFQIASIVGSTQFTYVMTGTAVTPATGTLNCNTIALPQTTQNIMAGVKCLKFGCGQNTGGVSIVGGQAQLPANIKAGQRMVVMVDTSTTGGCVPATGQGSRISGDYSASPQQSVWQASNAQAGERGYFRVAIATTPPDYVPINFVFGQFYLNYTSGGDNGTSQFPAWNDTTGLRFYQNAAATAESVASVSVSSLTNTTASLAIRTITSSGTTATVTTATAHNLFVGANVTISDADQTNYNGTFAVASVADSKTFTYAMTGTATSPATGSISGTYNLATAECASWHGLYPGFQFTISGASPSGYNSTYTVNKVVSSTEITFTVADAYTSPATVSGVLSWTPCYYNDLRPQFALRISNGIDVQGSCCWEFANSNDVHRNQYGDQEIAQFTYALIVTIPGLMTLLSSQTQTRSVEL